MSITNYSSSGGRAFCYIVPRDHGTVQKYAFGVNLILAFINRIFGKKQLAKKADVYRNGYFSDIYVKHLKNINVTEVQTFECLPLPYDLSVDFISIHPLPKFY